MNLRQLEARIKKLSEDALREQRDLEPVLRDLRAVLHEHNELLRKLTADTFSPERSLSLLKSSQGKRNNH